MAIEWDDFVGGVLSGNELNSKLGTLKTASNDSVKVRGNGTWSAVIDYVKNDIAKSGGSWWLSKGNNLNSMPVEGTDWTSFGGGSGGGHVIKNAAGTSLTQRTNLKFAGNSVAVADDAGGSSTVITIDHKNDALHSVAQPITILKDSVSVGTKTKLNLKTGDNFSMTASENGDAIDVTLSATQTAGYGGTSTSSVAIATGSKSFVIQPGLAYQVGSRVRYASSASPSNFMEGVVTAYSDDDMTVLVDVIGGTGTIAAWNVSLAGQKGEDGDDGAIGPAGPTSADVSTSTVTYGTGNKVFTVSAGKAFTVGQRLRASLATDSTKYLDGYVASYTGTTLTITVDKVASGATGTGSSWNINVGGQPGQSGTDGIDGDDGLLSAASQAEAEAGSENTKAMTPLRTAQAMAANGLLKSMATTKGDIYVATASGAVTRLGAGSNGQVLTVDSTQSSGLKYATPSGGGGGGTADDRDGWLFA